MKQIYLAQDIQQANLIIHLLEQHSVTAVILNQFTQGGVGELSFVQAYPEIWIEDETYIDKALQLIKDFENLPHSNKTINCLKCAEINPDNFETCWSCGADLGDASR